MLDFLNLYVKILERTMLQGTLLSIFILKVINIRYEGKKNDINHCLITYYY